MKDLLKEVKIKVDEDLVAQMIKDGGRFWAMANRLRKIVPDIDRYEKRLAEMNFDVFAKEIMSGGLNYPLQTVVMKSMHYNSRTAADFNIAYQLISEGFVKVIEYPGEEVTLLNGETKEVDIRLILCDRPFKKPAKKGKESKSVIYGFVVPDQFEDNWKNIYAYCGAADKYLYSTLRHELMHMYQYNFEGYGGKVFGLVNSKPLKRPPENETPEEQEEREKREEKEYFEHPTEFWPWVDTFYHGFLRMLDNHVLPNDPLVKLYRAENDPDPRYESDVFLDMEEKDKKEMTDYVLDLFRKYVNSEFEGKDPTHTAFIEAVKKSKKKFRRFYKSIYDRISTQQWMKDIASMNNVNYEKDKIGTYKKINESLLTEGVFSAPESLVKKVFDVVWGNYLANHEDTLHDVYMEYIFPYEKYFELMFMISCFKKYDYLSKITMPSYHEYRSDDVSGIFIPIAEEAYNAIESFEFADKKYAFPKDKIKAFEEFGYEKFANFLADIRNRELSFVNFNIFSHSVGINVVRNSRATKYEISSIIIENEKDLFKFLLKLLEGLLEELLSTTRGRKPKRYIPIKLVTRFYEKRDLHGKFPRNNMVMVRFEDLKDWEYTKDITMQEYRDWFSGSSLKFIIVEPIVGLDRQGSFSYSSKRIEVGIPKAITVSDAAKNNMFSTCRHEVIHWCQNILAELKSSRVPVGLSKRKPQPYPVRPVNPTDEEWEEYLIKHNTHPKEFYTLLNDEIQSFSERNIISSSIENDIKTFIVNSPFFRRLRNNDEKIFRKAVSKFYYAILHDKVDNRLKLNESITFSTEPTPSVYFYGSRFKLTDSEAIKPIRNYDSFSDRIQTHNSKGKRLKNPKNLGGRTTDANDIAFIDYIKSGNAIKIHVIHVRPDYQGKGYATKLLKQFFEEEVPEGAEVNWGKLMNEQSMRLFEKMKELYPNINQFGVKNY